MTDNFNVTKAELLQRIETAWQALNDELARLDEAAMTKIDLESSWAVVDHMNHLAAWVRGISYLLTRRSRYDGMGITVEQWRELTLDEINHVIQRRGRRRSPGDALENLRLAHSEFLDAMSELSDADLMLDYSEYDPAEPFTDRPVVGWITGNTLDHYQEHTGYIRRTVGR